MVHNISSVHNHSKLSSLSSSDGKGEWPMGLLLAHTKVSEGLGCKMGLRTIIYLAHACVPP